MSAVPVGGASSHGHRRSVRSSATPTTGPRARPAPRTTTRRTTQREAALAVGRINAALDAVTVPPPSQLHVLRGTTPLVCRATLGEWNAYVQSEDATISARFMAWFGPETTNDRATGEIRIVEYPVERKHESFVIQLTLAVCTDGVTPNFLSIGGAASNTRGPQLRPDASFGPKESVMRPLGVQLPDDIPTWDEFITIKVEIGVSQDWGETTGRLDWKAYQWAEVPGVAYVLCVRVDNDVQAASYKLYEVLATGQRPPYQPNAIPAAAPATQAQFDARRVLGLGPNDAVPVGFPIPFVIDLHAVLVATRATF